MNPLVSICVPIYNVAPYIERCVRSLMEQTYERIEYIFVNDASTDNSITLLKSTIEQYPHRCEQVRIIENERNYGLARTRRVGIEMAQGEWFCCVDSDDYIELDMVSSMVACITEGVDMVEIGYSHDFAKNSIIYLPKQIDADADYIRLAIEDDIAHLWMKLIRTKLFRADGGCYSPDGLNYLEDRIAILKLCARLRQIHVVRKVGYHYCANANSITARRTALHFECLQRFYQEAEQFLLTIGRYDEFKHRLEYNKVEDKTHLMLEASTLGLRRQYADLYRKEEAAQMHKMRRGYWLMSHLVHWHLWGALAIYQVYINARRKWQETTFFKKNNTNFAQSKKCP